MGGGTSGSFVFPYDTNVGSSTYWYKEMVQDVGTFIIAAQAANSPYYGETVPDPDTYMGTASAGMTQKEVSDLFTLVGAMVDTTDYAAFITSLVSQLAASFPTLTITTDVAAIHTAERSAIDSAMTAALAAAATAVAGSPVAALVTAFAARARSQYLKAMARHASSMADIGAVNSSAFVFGLASIDNELLNDTNLYHAGLDMEVYKQYFSIYMQTFGETFKSHIASYAAIKQMREGHKDAFIMSGAGDLSRMYMGRINSNINMTQLQAEVNRIRYVAQSEKARDQLSIDVHDATWDFDLFTYGGNLLAAAGGAAMMPPKMSKAQSALGGAATGASVGAAVGGIPGAAVGGLIGGVAGLFG